MVADRDRSLVDDAVLARSRLIYSQSALASQSNVMGRAGWGNPRLGAPVQQLARLCCSPRNVLEAAIVRSAAAGR